MPKVRAVSLDLIGSKRLMYSHFQALLLRQQRPVSEQRPRLNFLTLCRADGFRFLQLQRAMVERYHLL
jgi:hypothetical protein